MTEFDTVIWEGAEEDGGDGLCLLYSSELDVVSLQDVTHDVTVFLEPSTYRQALAEIRREWAYLPNPCDRLALGGATVAKGARGRSGAISARTPCDFV